MSVVSIGKHLFSFLFIIIVLNSQSHFQVNANLFKTDAARNSKAIENLDDYSYFLYALINENSIQQGSGFFIKAKKRLFFVTAAHSFTGWNFMLNKQGREVPDKFFVRITNNSNPTYLEIDAKPYKQNKKTGFLYETPDISVFEVIDKNIFKLVKVVNKFISNSIDCKSVKHATISGFPIIPNQTKTTVMTAKASLAEGYLGKSFCEKMKYLDINREDSINYRVNIIKGKIGSGYSGSLVFFTIDNKIYFGGLCEGGNIENNYALVVRPQYVLLEIQAEKKKKRKR